MKSRCCAITSLSITGCIAWSLLSCFCSADNKTTTTTMSESSDESKAPRQRLTSHHQKHPIRGLSWWRQPCQAPRSRRQMKLHAQQVLLHQCWRAKGLREPFCHCFEAQCRAPSPKLPKWLQHDGRVLYLRLLSCFYCPRWPWSGDECQVSCADESLPGFSGL